MIMMTNKKLGLVLSTGLVVALVGCATGQFAVRPAPEVARLNRIAVFPLENFSGVQEAGSGVTSMLVSNLYNSNLVNLVEPGEVQQFILRSRIRFASQLDRDTIRQAASQLNCDGIIFGSVNEYTMVTTDLGQLPAVSISLRLVNASTGDIAWSATHSLQGDFKETVFGIGRVNSLGTLSEIVVQDLISALGAAMYPEKGLAEAKMASKGVKGELVPSKPKEGPVIPLAPTKTEPQNAGAEKEKASSEVQKEWETIKGLSK